MKTKIFKTPEELADETAEQLMQNINARAQDNKFFFLAISGGSTPQYLFKRLSVPIYNKSIRWDMLHIFWVDERCVPPADAESNYGMTKKILLDKIEIPAKNIHRILGENNPAQEPERYAAEIRSIVPFKNTLPEFDWILLGIGSDGHTASLFPGGVLENVADEICGSAVHPQTGQDRISLTYDTINNGRRKTFLVTGKEKAVVLKKILNKDPEAANLPSAKINGAEWFVDEDAYSG